jgi:regulatory protein
MAAAPIEPAITRLVALAKPAGAVAIYVGRSKAAVISAGYVSDLGLNVGQAWTRDLAQRVHNGEAIDRARAEILRVLARKAVGISMLRERLLAKGHEPVAVDRVIEMLRRQGVLDESRLAESVARTRGRDRGEMGVRAELESRGFDSRLASSVAAEQAESGDPLAQARAFIVKKRRTMPKLPTDIMGRRLLAAMSRRGFVEEIAHRAIEAELGRKSGRMPGLGLGEEP